MAVVQELLRHQCGYETHVIIKVPQNPLRTDEPFVPVTEVFLPRSDFPRDQIVSESLHFGPNARQLALLSAR